MFKKDVIVERFDEDALLVDLDSEKIFQLNQTGARIAELVVEGRSFQEMLTFLDREYDINSFDIERDVLELLGELLAYDLIIPTTSPR